MKRAKIDSETMDFVASPSYSREIYKYIQFRFDAEHKEVTAAACDGFRLSVEKAAALEIEEDFTVYIRPCYRFPRKTYVLISLENEEAIIRCNGNITGCAQIKGDFLNYENFCKARQVSLRIAFNPNLLMDAVKAAKASLGPASKNPIMLEFTTPKEPAYIITKNGNGFRMVLPVRILEDYE